MAIRHAHDRLEEIVTLTRRLLDPGYVDEATIRDMVDQMTSGADVSLLTDDRVGRLARLVSDAIRRSLP